jgi:translation initiation factor 2B subunit (eIF-2B alpha/beta/delta family)
MNLDALVAPLRADVVSGASVVARTAADVVRRAAGRIPASSVEGFREIVSELLVKILDAQPAMASLVALGRDVLLALEEATEVEGAREAAALASSSYREFLDWSGGEISDRTGEVIDEGSVVLTLSASSTVRRSLERLVTRGPLTVICLEGRPMAEGQRMAQQLAAVGGSVIFAVDAAAESLLEDADCVLIGADSLGDRGVVNKIGSRGLARAARDRGTPVHVLMDRTKFLPPGFPQPTEDPRPAEEVWRAPPGVRVWNRYFETFPASLVTNFVTESGVVTPEDAEAQRRDLPVPPELRTWAERWI